MMNINTLSKAYTPTFPNARRGQDGPAIEGFQDRFTPSEASCEMPDPRRLRELLAASEKASNEKWERIGVDPRRVMGGLDSPLFVDGKVTTKRQLILEGKADPVTWGAY